ncbi:hypothetical protein BZG36_02275 [Bifiguratus adelaidae]|uniref:PCI domain-containing protein n=1 Tax=Bifiguratus adelaidae TaxID=1938954 RepID=A0A261XYA3_9FUNG|nr:hypothetical protein BZG36_02275 [Bifiguratus adelaidae]
MAQTYVKELSELFSNKDGDSLVEYMYFVPSGSDDLALLQSQLRSVPDLEKLVDANFEADSNAVREFVVQYLILVKRHYNAQDYETLYAGFHEFFSSLVAAYNGPDAFWMSALVRQLCQVLVQTAKKTDLQHPVKLKDRKTQDAARQLTRVFNVMLSDRNPMPRSKKAMVLWAANQAFAIYFKSHTVRLCQTFISNIETAGIQLSQYPKGQQITYRYYVGRYYLFQHQLRKAEAELAYAFLHCPVASFENRRLCFLYLVAARLPLGILPTQDLLDKYQLSDQFTDLMNAILAGNFIAFEQSLAATVAFHLKTGNYMILRERVQIITFRCLFRKVHLVTSSQRLSFQDCLAALKFSTGDNSYTLYDVESNLVSLIDQGYIKGYIAHDQQVVILSKTNAFPQVDTVVRNESENSAAEEQVFMETPFAGVDGADSQWL